MVERWGVAEGMGGGGIHAHQYGCLLDRYVGHD